MWKLLRVISLAAALFAVIHHAHAAEAGKKPVSPKKDAVAVATQIYNDLVTSQTMAGPASAPIDPTGYACYTDAVTQMAGFSSTQPNGLISTGEAVWLLIQTVNKLASDTNCQAVCGRINLLATKVGGLVGGLVVPNVCGVFTSLAD